MPPLFGPDLPRYILLVIDGNIVTRGNNNRVWRAEKHLPQLPALIVRDRPNHAAECAIQIGLLQFRLEVRLASMFRHDDFGMNRRNGCDRTTVLPATSPNPFDEARVRRPFLSDEG